MAHCEEITSAYPLDYNRNFQKFENVSVVKNQLFPKRFKSVGAILGHWI